LAASSLQAQRTEWRLLPLLCVAFAALHLSYGLGFLEGLIGFWNRWADRGQWKALAPQCGP